MPPCNSVPKHHARRPWPCEARPAGTYQPLDAEAPCEAARARSPRFGCAHSRARGRTRLQESVSGVRVVRPEVTSLGSCPSGLRTPLVGRMRGHRRRTERPPGKLRKRWVWQQRKLRLTEERPPRHMASVALTSDRPREGQRVGMALPRSRGRPARDGLARAGRGRWLDEEVRGFSGGSRHGRQRRA